MSLSAHPALVIVDHQNAATYAQRDVNPGPQSRPQQIVRSSVCHVDKHLQRRGPRRQLTIESLSLKRPSCTAVISACERLSRTVPLVQPGDVGLGRGQADKQGGRNLG